MNNIFALALLLVLDILLISIAVKINPQERVIDCSMSEFHPDTPSKARQECRNIRSNKTT